MHYRHEPTPTWTKEEWIAELKKHGNTVYQLAAHLKMSEKRVSGILKRQGILTEKMHRIPRKARKKLHLWHTDHLRRELAKHRNSSALLAKWARRSDRYVRKILHERGIRWTPDEHRTALHGVPMEVILRAYFESGMNSHMAARKLGIAPHTMELFFRSKGIKIKTGIRHMLWTKEMLHRWYVTHGRTIYEIAQKLGVHPAAVQRRLTSFKIPMRSRGVAWSKLKDRPPLPEDWNLSIEELNRRNAEAFVEAYKRKYALANDEPDDEDD